MVNALGGGLVAADVEFHGLGTKLIGGIENIKIQSGAE
jgi:hypothetical protein